MKTDLLIPYKMQCFINIIEWFVIYLISRFTHQVTINKSAYLKSDNNYIKLMENIWRKSRTVFIWKKWYGRRPRTPVSSPPARSCCFQCYSFARELCQMATGQKVSLLRSLTVAAESNYFCACDRRTIIINPWKRRLVHLIRDGITGETSSNAIWLLLILKYNNTFVLYLFVKLRVDVKLRCPIYVSFMACDFRAV